MWGVRLVILSLLAAGCASMSNVQTADTLGKGNFQAAIEPGLWGGASAAGVAAIPHVDASVRFGVSERVDLGVRAGSSFLELQSKFMFTDPENPLWAGSIAPTLGGIFASGSSQASMGSSNATGIFNLGVPVLVGLKLRGGHQIILGPRVQTLLVFGSGSPTTVILGLGSSVGFAWRLTDNFILLPEVSAVYPVVGGDSTGAIFRDLIAAGGTFVQFKLGILFGRMRPRAGEDTAPQQRRGQPPPTEDTTAQPPPPPPSL
jgi:hypothetical protein